MHQNHRYPGIRPFTFDDKNLFFGRDEDIDNLCQMIYLERLVVLYGKSGLGKTSLLNAGVVPQLQAEMDISPYMIRFGSNMEGKNLTPLQILKERLNKDISTDNFLGEIVPNPDSLWYYFKHMQIAHGRDKHYLLVFDQFEELFTYSEQAIYEFKREIATITNNNIPKSFKAKLRSLLESGNSPLSEEQLNLLYQPLNVKIVMAIRSDRMSLLDKFKDYLPDILQKTYELEPLSIGQAKVAIIEPAQADGDFSTPPFTYEPTALRKILRYLSNDNTQKIESFQLQIICQNMEEYASRNKVDNITLSDVGDLNQVIKNYYDHQIELIGTPDEQYATRVLIEEGLIFEPEERRLSLYEGQIYQSYNISEELLNRLVHARLLRAEPNTAGGFSYELCHDTLVGPILKSKTKRLAKEKAEADRLAKIEAEEIERQKRAKARLRYLTILGIVAVAGLISLGFAIWAFNQKAALEVTNKQIELKNQEIAENLAQLSEQEKQLQREKTAALAARDTAELRRIEAEQSEIEADRARQLADLANVNLSKELEAKAGESNRFRALLEESWLNPLSMGQEDFSYAIETLVPLMREDTVQGTTLLNSLRMAQNAKDKYRPLKFQYYFAEKALDLKPDNKVALNILDNLRKEVLFPNQSFELPKASTFDVTTFALSPDKETLVLATNQSIQIHSLENPNAIPHTIEVGHLSPVQKIIFSPDGKRFASVHQYSFDANFWEIDDPYNLPEKPSYSITDSSRVTTVAFYPDNSGILVGNNTGRIDQYDLNGAYKANLISQSTYGDIGFIQFHKDKDKIIYNIGGKGKLYSLKEGKSISDFDYTTHLCTDSKGKLFAKADLSSVYIYEVNDRSSGLLSSDRIKQQKSYPMDESIQRVAFTEDDKYIIAQGNNSIYVIDLSKEEASPVYKLHGHDSRATGIHISGKEIIVCRNDAKVNIWDLNNPSPFSKELIYEYSPITMADQYQEGFITYEEILENGTKAEKKELADYLLSQYIYDEELEKAAKLDPGNIEVNFKRADNAFYDGNYALADSLLRAALEKEPENTKVLNLLGRTLYNLGQYTESLSYYEKLEQIDTARSLDYSIGLSALMARQYDKAKDRLEQYTQDYPYYTSGFNALALVYSDQAEYEKALQLFDKAIELDSLSYYPYRNKGQVYYKRGLAAVNINKPDIAQSEFLTARQYYQKALELNSAYDYLYEAGLVEFQLQEYEKAINFYKESLKIKPNLESALIGMINVFFRNKDILPFEEVRSVHDKLIELRPDDKAAYHDRGRMHFNFGKYEEAIADYSKSIELDSVYYVGYANRGMTHEILLDYEQALRDYNKALEIKKNQIKQYPEFYSSRDMAWPIESITNVYLTQKDYDKASESYAAYYEIQRDQSPRNDSLFASSCGNMSYYLLLANKPKEAGQYAQQGLDVAPTQTWIYTNLALSKLLTGDKAGAFTIYNDLKNQVYLEGGQYYREIFLDDLEALLNAGIEIPDLEEARSVIKAE